jgi:hypothetical protein
MNRGLNQSGISKKGVGLMTCEEVNTRYPSSLRHNPLLPASIIVNLNKQCIG